MEDLVADGLITMYMDTYAKDYIDTMMVDQVMDKHKQSKQQKTKTDSGQSKQDQSDGATKQEVKVTSSLNSNMRNCHCYI